MVINSFFPNGHPAIRNESAEPHPSTGQIWGGKDMGIGSEQEMKKCQFSAIIL